MFLLQVVYGVFNLVCGVFNFLGSKILSILLAPVQVFTRKHGRWKFRRLFPVAFLVLSCVTVPMHTSAFMARTAHAAKTRHVQPFRIPNIPWDSGRDNLQLILDEIGEPPPTFIEHHYADDWEAYLAREAFKESFMGAVFSEESNDDAVNALQQGEQ